MAAKTTLINNMYMGNEPEYGDEEISELDLGVSLNWYSYMKDNDDAKNYLIKYCSDNHIDVDINNKKHVVNTFGWLARIVTLGGILPKKNLDSLKDYIESLKTSYNNDNEEQQSSDSSTNHKNQKLEQMLERLEEAVDNFGLKFNPFEYYVKMQPTQLIVKKIIEKYTPEYEEVKIAYQGDDPEIKEAYSCYNKLQLQACLNLLSSIINDGYSYINNNKRQRKPRKKKAKSIDSLFKYFKYKQTDNRLKVSSDNPEKIIGASAVYVLNTSNNILSMFVSSDPNQGLSVSRTSIVNYDSNLSISKRVGRNIEEIIQKILEGTKRSRLKVLDGVSSSNTKFVDRLNDNSIILKVDR